jgi:hypothetical protein
LVIKQKELLDAAQTIDVQSASAVMMSVRKSLGDISTAVKEDMQEELEEPAGDGPQAQELLLMQERVGAVAARAIGSDYVLMRKDALLDVVQDAVNQGVQQAIVGYDNRVQTFAAVIDDGTGVHIEQPAYNDFTDQTLIDTDALKSKITAKCQGKGEVMILVPMNRYGEIIDYEVVLEVIRSVVNDNVDTSQKAMQADQAELSFDLTDIAQMFDKDAASRTVREITDGLADMVSDEQDAVQAGAIPPRDPGCVEVTNMLKKHAAFTRKISNTIAKKVQLQVTVVGA